MNIMKIELKRVNKAVHFEGKNDSDAVIHLDGAPLIGGEKKGMRPMQLLLTSLGGCSSMDVISILKKQKQEIEEMSVVIEGERDPDEVPSVFRKIHVHFILSGILDQKRVERAIDLSLNKYCSVAKMIDRVAHIRSTFEIR
jgi:putative redox protein